MLSVFSGLSCWGISFQKRKKVILVVATSHSSQAMHSMLVPFGLAQRSGVTLVLQWSPTMSKGIDPRLVDRANNGKHPTLPMDD